MGPSKKRAASARKTKKDVTDNNQPAAKRKLDAEKQCIDGSNDVNVVSDKTNVLLQSQSDTGIGSEFEDSGLLAVAQSNSEDTNQLFSSPPALGDGKNFNTQATSTLTKNSKKKLVMTENGSDVSNIVNDDETDDDDEETDTRVTNIEIIEMMDNYKDLIKSHNDLKNRYEEMKEQNSSMRKEMDAIQKKVVKEKPKKIKVRKEIRSYVRRGYKELDHLNEGEWFFYAGESMFSSRNLEMSNKLRCYIKGLDSSALDEEINIALTTYYTSLKNYNERRKKDPSLQDSAAKYQRKQHKMKKRIAAVDLKRSYPVVKKGKVKKCLTMEFMSSEDEEDDGSFSIRPLPWRSEVFEKILQELDAKTRLSQSKKSKRQTILRKIGEPSARPPPEHIEREDTWSIGKPNILQN